ncbi:carbohydrate binding family 9 domain-containing protein [Tamlana agarivorans]|uniref:Carbohydrate binding family 9 domain-containing protein n=1 Tax=Pseudotamlana agarivorans TaxID=481183 RepID=A0ACC5U8A3_9FLAO|nr:DUF5916 domain-containing protein [Tamlana agarivorans]MBU2950546.1 carbohydrate binding family 9 domain-containing protein [Tamlana agarivorans]
MNYSNVNLTPVLVFRFLLGFLIFIASVNGYAQKSITVNYVNNDDFIIDGVLDEVMWKNAVSTSGFSEYFPTDNKQAVYQTEIMMLYNDGYLYIGVKGYAPGEDYRTPSYERDFSISGADIVNLMFDTYSDRSNAFLFGINPFGVEREGIIYGGGVAGDLDLNWNTKWVGESQMYDGYFISELKIPMSAFKFKEGITSWKFSAMRSDTQSNTKSSWARVPQNQNQLNLGYFGDLIFEKPLVKTRNPISVIPFVTPSYTNEHYKGEKSFNFKAGFDAKIPVKSSLMLDLTVLPDFSSDDVVSGQNNVTQFEIKQDETRLFFIDNGDLFNGFGESNALAFYSRRVGVGKDTLGQDKIVPIIAGAKFTGKINNNLRIGVLDVQTEGEGEYQIGANNNLVVAAEQRVFEKSNIGAFFINRQATNNDEFLTGTSYNRVIGSDFNFYSKDNSVDGKVFLHKSFTPDISSNAISAGTILNVEKRKYSLDFTSQYVDAGFQSDLGFTKRKDIVRVNPSGAFNMYPKSDNINTIILNASYNAYWRASEDMSLSERYTYLGGEINFTSGASIGLQGTNAFEYLYSPFDPVGDKGNGDPIPVGGYTTNYLDLDFNTDRRKAFWLEGSSRYGSFYMGHKFTTDVTFQYRYQPYFYVSLQLQYDDIKLPEPYSSGQIWYLGPTLNVTFSKTLFFNTDIQYSSQSNYFLLVSRLQWRYAPLSDVFLTYTTTDTTAPFELVERGIYLKVTYWLDIKRKNKK